MLPFIRSKWHEPVTSRAAPANVSSTSAFCQRITLKENYQSLAILRHQCRLPAPTTALVEQVGQGVFVLPSMSCELHYHSLVFFHLALEIMAMSTPSPSGAEAEK